jgi:hypothetical protein
MKLSLKARFRLLFSYWPDALANSTFLGFKRMMRPQPVSLFFLSKVRRPAVFIMPDNKGRPGAVRPLANPPRLDGWKVTLAVIGAGSVMLAGYLLRLAWFAARIPYPGR